MAKSKYIETLEEQYTKKDAKSVLRYKAPDGKWRYVQTSKDASGGNMPSGGGMVEVKWQELKDKRGNGELNPGSLYRITDYQCTTTQENTRSAGHQFDIVLLALSEDKLAEEGWAMNHGGVDMFNDYDIYTITFNDGVSKQVYYKVISNPPNDAEHRIVDTETFLGFRIWHNPAQDGFVINTENKTATNAYISSTEFESYLQTQYSYNYFQNSNLSAWKVWYCLDNDTARFAWADDSVDNTTFESIVVENTTYTRSPNDDDLSLSESLARYAWRNGSTVGYTINEHPDFNEVLFDGPGSKLHIGTITNYTPAHEGSSHPEYIETVEEGETIRWVYEEDYNLHGLNFAKWSNNNRYIYTLAVSKNIGDETYRLQVTPRKMMIPRNIPISNYQPEHLVYNGRGVIYRLIDEWNNDVGYDFKNIQFVRKLTDGKLDTSTGTNTWVYTLNNIDEQPYDASLNTITSDNSTNNKIDSLYTFINEKNYFELPDVVILYGGGFNNISKSQIITILQNVVKMQGCQDCIIGNADSQFYICDALTTTESDAPAIYINNKKVLTEK